MARPPGKNRSLRYIRVAADQAGVHLQRMGDTIAPSFFRAANALSTTLRSSPVSSATLPALTGSPALRIASSTMFFSSMIVIIYIDKKRLSIVSMTGIHYYEIAIVNKYQI